MPWFRLDDSFHSHPKVLAAGNEAIGLYARCGTYAAQHSTDGFIPENVALLYGSAALVESLVRAKLWRRARGGWRMPDYLDYNPSKEVVDKERKAKAERQRRWREAQRRRVTNAPVTPAPPRPAPKEAGRGKPAPVAAANGRASPRRPPAAARPPWCGNCDQQTRLTGDPPRRCILCHPLADNPEARAYRATHQEDTHAANP